MADVVIFGTGKMAQMAKVYIDRHGPHRIVGFTVDAEFKTSETFEGHPVIVWEDLERHFPPDSVELLGPMTAKRLNGVRRDRFNEGLARGYDFASFIHPNNYIYTDAIGKNCIVLENNVLQPFASIGDNVIIWSGCVIAHHVSIGAHCFISSQCGISGSTTIGEQCYMAGKVGIGPDVTVGDQCFLGGQVGIGAGVRIGDRCVLLDGAGVVRDLPDETVVRVTRGVRGNIQAFPSSRIRHIF